jgi:hypothetical protein
MIAGALLVVCVGGAVWLAINSSTDSPLESMARLVEAGSPTAQYYLVTPAPLAQDPMLRQRAGTKSIRDVASVMDTLGVDPEHGREAVFIFAPSLVEAAFAVRRCYPGARLLVQPSAKEVETVIALAVAPQAVDAGRNCTLIEPVHGLRARYFKGADWNGPVSMARVEDWPVRFRHDLERYQSIEWTGTLEIPAAGTHQFQLWSRNARGSAAIGAQVSVEAGTPAVASLAAGIYPLRIRCKPQSTDGACWLRWAPPGGQLQAIPSVLLRPADATTED